MLGWGAFWTSRWLFDSRHDSFAGNFIGGVIGGIIAYLIARYQFWKQQQIGLANRRKMVNASRLALLTEIKYNIKVINSIIPDLNADQHLKIKIKSRLPMNCDIWNSVRLLDYLVESLSIEEYERLADVYAELKTLDLLMEKSLPLSTFFLLKTNLEETIEVLIDK